MRRAPRPLAIVLAASTVTFSLVALTGCGGDEASRADRNVNQQVAAAYTTDKPIDALKEAADNDKASGASRARAKSMLADAEVLAANDQMRQIEQHENQIASLIWELGQLGQSINTSTRLIAAYRTYDPAVVQQSADTHVAEAKGDAFELKNVKAGKIAGLSAVAKNTAALQDAITKQKAELDGLTAKRAQLLQQADEAARDSESAKDRAAVDAYAKASGLRKDAAMVSSQIDNANSMLARLNADLTVQQGQQQVLANLVTEYQAGANATDKGFKAVAAQEEAQQALIKEIYGPGKPAAPTTNPVATPSNIVTRSTELAAAVAETDQLRASAEASLKSAIQHYTEAQQAAEDLRRKIDEKMGASSAADAPERLAWEDMKKLMNPSAYQLQKSVALQTLGSLYAGNTESLTTLARLAATLSKTLQPAGLKLPESIAVKDAQAQIKEVVENTNKTFADASDLQDNVIAAPLATESQKAAARVGKILTLYSWGNAQASAGNAAEARKHRAEAVEQVKGAVADNVTLPALPPDIAPAVKTAAPTTPAPTPGKAAAPAASTADAATVEAVKQSLTAAMDGALKGDADAIKGFINASPEQQPLVDTIASLVSSSVKLQTAVVAKFGEEGKKALTSNGSGMQMSAPDPAQLKAALDQIQVAGAGPDAVTLAVPGQPQAIPLKKIGDQWKLDLVGLAQSSPQMGAMLPMVTLMLKPMAQNIDQITTDVDAGKYATVAEVQAALKKAMPMQGGFPGANHSVAQQGTAPQAAPPAAQ